MDKKKVIQKLELFDKKYGGHDFKQSLNKFIRSPRVYFKTKLVEKGLAEYFTQKIELFHGDKIFVRLNDRIGRKLAKQGFFVHPAEVALTKFLINNLSDEIVFYDIGANYGFYSSLANFFKAQTFLFEPNITLKECLLRSFGNNDDIKCIFKAVWEASGEEIDMYEQPEHSGLTSVAEKCNRGEYENGIEEFSCQTISLDDFTKKHVDPTHIKIDVEGVELQVLKGAKKLLSTQKPVLMLEATSYSGYKKLKMYVEQFDYDVFKINHEGLLEEISQAKNLFFDGRENIVCR